MIIKVVFPSTGDAVETEDYPDQFLINFRHIVRAARYNAALSEDDRRLARDLDDCVTWLQDENRKPSITV